MHIHSVSLRHKDATAVRSSARATMALATMLAHLALDVTGTLRSDLLDVGHDLEEKSYVLAGVDRQWDRPAFQVPSKDQVGCLNSVSTGLRRCADSLLQYAQSPLAASRHDELLALAREVKAVGEKAGVLYTHASTLIQMATPQRGGTSPSAPTTGMS